MTESGRRRVALVSGGFSDFIVSDAELLRQLGARVQRVGRLPHRIFRSIRNATHVIVWFAAEHAFYAVAAARFFKKPSLLLIGGFEAAADRDIGYGLWLQPWHVGVRARWAIRRASELWAVAPHLAPGLFELGGVRPRAYKVVHTVFDSARFAPAGVKDVDVVFVCPSAQPDYWVRKRLADLVAAARMLPDASFVVLGTQGPQASPPLGNVEYGGFLSPDGYANRLNRARVIVNASLYEGLANGLCQGMLAGAVPVVSSIPGNLYAVDGLEARGLSFTFPPRDVERLAHAIQGGLAISTAGEREAIRDHILQRFPVETRLEAFQSFLDARRTVPTEVPSAKGET
ncbi:MAG: glycosyltransferase [Thermoplasmata archaeon]